MSKGELRDLYCAVYLTPLKCFGFGFADELLVLFLTLMTTPGLDQRNFLHFPWPNPGNNKGQTKAIPWKSAFEVPIFNSVPYSNLIHFCQTPKGLFLIKLDHGFLTQLTTAQSYQDASTRPDFFEGISTTFQTPPSCYFKQDTTGTSSITVNI